MKKTNQMKVLKNNNLFSTIIVSIFFIYACSCNNELRGLNFRDYTIAVLDKIKNEKYSDVKCLYDNKQDNDNMLNIFSKVHSLILEKGIPNKENIIIEEEFLIDGYKNAFVTVYFDSVSDKALNKVTFMLNNRGSETKISFIMP